MSEAVTLQRPLTAKKGKESAQGELKLSIQLTELERPTWKKICGKCIRVTMKCIEAAMRYVYGLVLLR